MDINYSRYMDSIIKKDKDTFLRKWKDKTWKKFYKKHEDEYNHYYNCLLKELKETMNPAKIHKLEFFFVMLPAKLESWLCCGFKWNYNKKDNQWTWFENYHMVYKLCRYKTYPNVKITWWDRLRFKWITGYDFE